MLYYCTLSGIRNARRFPLSAKNAELFGYSLYSSPIWIGVIFHISWHVRYVLTAWRSYARTTGCLNIPVPTNFKNVFLHSSIGPKLQIYIMAFDYATLSSLLLPFYWFDSPPSPRLSAPPSTPSPFLSSLSNPFLFFHLTMYPSRLLGGHTRF
jgi:hypothetical protein